jgi:thiol-disulfide isomerase/thioredoxin
MKKYLIILAAALMVIGCHRKPAQQEKPTANSQELTAENMYIDFTAVTPEGEEMSLSDLVGKTDFVLVDFWASWCGPCRRLIPVLKEIYMGQPEGRLQILSCSIDRDDIAWRSALGEELMPWPQVRQDEDHNCSDLYDVQFIPHTVLINREGRIVGVNLEEPEIEEILFNE